MGDSWLELVERVLRPERREIARCLRERTEYLATRKRLTDERMRAIVDCERRIEGARAAVFAASDGVVGARMTGLEREWRRLSRTDPDVGVMDLWARIAPREWLDRKRWRDAPPAERADVAVALASDVDGVEHAEAAVGSLRAALASCGAEVGARIAWRFFDHDRALANGLLRAAGVMSCALRDDVQAAALARFPDRPLLARDLAMVARAANVASAANIVTSLRTVWKTGYWLAGIDPKGVTLELPPIL